MTPNLKLQEAIRAVKNFRDRYKEWAEKDNTDVNVSALNTLISVAQSIIDKGEAKQMTVVEIENKIEDFAEWVDNKHRIIDLNKHSENELATALFEAVYGGGKE